MSFLNPEPANSEGLYKQISQKPRHPAVKYFLTICLMIAMIFPIYSPFYNGNHEGILPPYQFPFIMLFAFCLSWFSRPEFFPYRISNPTPDEMETAALYRAQKIALPLNIIIILLLCLWCSMGAAYNIPHPETKRDWTSASFALAMVFPLMTHVIAEWASPIIGEGDDMNYSDPLPQTHKENMQEIARRPRYKYVKWGMLFAIIATGMITSINAVNSDQSISMVQIIALPFSIMLVNCMISPFSRGMFLGIFINPHYDEFEIAALNRARHISLWIVNGLVISLCAWCYFGAVIDIPHPITARNWISVAMFFLVLPPLLPAVIAEWIIPFPPEGDEV